MGFLFYIIYKDYFCVLLVLCYLSYYAHLLTKKYFFFLCILDAIKADIEQSLSVDKSNIQNDFYIGPYLDGNEVTNITVQIGTNAYLPCKVCVIDFFFLCYFYSIECFSHSHTYNKHKDINTHTPTHKGPHIQTYLYTYIKMWLFNEHKIIENIGNYGYMR